MGRASHPSALDRSDGTAMSSSPHPTREHIKKLFEELTRAWAAEEGEDRVETRHAIVLQGAHTLERYDSDRELPFRELVKRSPEALIHGVSDLSRCMMFLQAKNPTCSISRAAPSLLQC